MGGGFVIDWEEGIILCIPFRRERDCCHIPLSWTGFVDITLCFEFVRCNSEHLMDTVGPAAAAAIHGYILWELRFVLLVDVLPSCNPILFISYLLVCRWLWNYTSGILAYTGVWFGCSGYGWLWTCLYRFSLPSILINIYARSHSTNTALHEHYQVRSGYRRILPLICS